MIEVTQTEFRQSIKKYSDRAIDEGKIIKIASVKHRNLIVMSEETYRSMLKDGKKYDYGLYTNDTFHQIEEASTEDDLNAVLKMYAKKLIELHQGRDE